jgi:hypothetical protein
MIRFVYEGPHVGSLYFLYKEFQTGNKCVET